MFTAVTAMTAAGLGLMTGCDDSAGNAAESSTATTSTPAVGTEAPTAATPTASTVERPAATDVPNLATRKASADDAAGGPRIDFAKRVHDFGSIWDIEEQSYMFSFTNTGGSTLIIDDDVKTSCGCTAAKPDKFEYAPGESGSIGISFKPKGFGRQAKTITVKSNAVNDPSVTLVIQSNIQQFVTVEPHMLRFEDVLRGQPQSKVVAVTSVDPDLEITDVQSRHPAMNARLIDAAAGPSQSDAGGSAEPRLIEVTVNENVAWGRVYGAVDVHTRGRLSSSRPLIDHKVTVTVNANAFGEIIADPPLVQMGVVKPGEPFSKVCKLFSRSDRPFEVLNAELLGSNVPGMRVDIAPLNEPGRTGYAIVVSGDPGTYVGTIRGTLHINTDVPGDETINIRVAGVIRESLSTK